MHTGAVTVIALFSAAAVLTPARDVRLLARTGGHR
jgi:hypothetical protein